MILICHLLCKAYAVVFSGVKMSESVETIEFKGVRDSPNRNLKSGEIFLCFWSDFGQIFGQNWSDSQSDF